MSRGDASAPAAASQRLFVAVALSAAVRAELSGVAEQLAAAGVRARRVPPENYHATVAFLGTVSAAAARDVAPRIREAARHGRPFSVQVDRIGGFPSEARARVLWAGTSQASPRFAALCGGVRDGLIPLGFAFERDATFHVTLFRAPRPMRIPADVRAPVSRVGVDALTLYASQGTPHGVRYVILETFALGRTGAKQFAANASS